MIDDVTIAIATAVAGKVGESLTKGAGEALKKLRKAVFERFRDHPEAQKALAEAQIDAEDTVVVRELAGHLDTARTEDPEIRRLIERLRPEFDAGRDNVHNTISGDVHGTAIQARDISGGLNLGG
ncbi:hypothetical protein [Allosalinactinospora lopnorensis]|uniref:hypothetical protein n=1 Tax=Allosalinactinospora lopnorensis TaxID=1352348 RepID=UPI000623E987|nr:hypothetical protein [Allosalinactinospora lopnorensis]